MVILKVGAGAEHWAEKETAKRARRSFEIDLSEEVSKLAVHCFFARFATVNPSVSGR